MEFHGIQCLPWSLTQKFGTGVLVLGEEHYYTFMLDPKQTAIH